MNNDLTPTEYQTLVARLAEENKTLRLTHHIQQLEIERLTRPTAGPPEGEPSEPTG